jgi:23S rRNA pseudouridine1911/1915/1917 synthase
MKIQVLETDRGKRLDSLLHERLAEFSRSRLQSWIRDGRVLVDGQTSKSSHVLRGNEIV